MDLNTFFKHLSKIDEATLNSFEAKLGSIDNSALSTFASRIAEYNSLANTLINNLSSKKDLSDFITRTSGVPSKKELDEKIKNYNADALIPYDTAKQSAPGQPIVRSSGKAPIVDMAGRFMVVKKVGNLLMPFYLSSGMGGKKDVPPGKWYPFFGIWAESGNTWINKPKGKEIANYYGSEILKSVSNKLDSELGDIEHAESIPKIYGTGKFADFINSNLGISPVENGKPDSEIRLRENMKKVLDAIGSSTPEGNQPKQQTEGLKDLFNPKERNPYLTFLMNVMDSLEKEK